jgi:hypothetical protein
VSSANAANITVMPAKNAHQCKPRYRGRRAPRPQHEGCHEQRHPDEQRTMHGAVARDHDQARLAQEIERLAQEQRGAERGGRRERATRCEIERQVEHRDDERADKAREHAPAVVGQDLVQCARAAHVRAPSRVR